MKFVLIGSLFATAIEAGTCPACTVDDCNGSNGWQNVCYKEPEACYSKCDPKMNPCTCAPGQCKEKFRFTQPDASCYNVGKDCFAPCFPKTASAEMLAEEGQELATAYSTCTIGRHSCPVSEGCCDGIKQAFAAHPHDPNPPNLLSGCGSDDMALFGSKTCSASAAEISLFATAIEAGTCPACTVDDCNGSNGWQNVCYKEPEACYSKCDPKMNPCTCAPGQCKEKFRFTQPDASCYNVGKDCFAPCFPKTASAETAAEMFAEPAAVDMVVEPRQMMVGFGGFLIGASVVGLAIGLKRRSQPLLEEPLMA